MVDYLTIIYMCIQMVFWIQENNQSKIHKILLKPALKWRL